MTAATDASRERDLLGDAVKHAFDTDACDEDLAQLRLRLDRYDLETHAQQRASELSGPRGQIEHAVPGSDLQLSRNGLRGRRCVLGAPALV